MKAVVYSSNDPVLSGAEMALCAIARETRVTSADCLGRSVVPLEGLPSWGVRMAAPAFRPGWAKPRERRREEKKTN